jgi:hypothetical protein
MKGQFLLGLVRFLGVKPVDFKANVTFFSKRSGRQFLDVFNRLESNYCISQRWLSKSAILV